jgi:hypothetical protein
VKQRVKAHLDNVALCRPGLSAYKSAEVIAVRTDPVVIENPAVDEALERIGFEPMLRRAIVRKPWDGSQGRFDDEQWQASCILDRGERFDTVKSRWAFPVLEPNGDLNVNGMHAAAARLNQTTAGTQAKAKAARKLVRYYRQAGETPPASLTQMASR